MSKLSIILIIVIIVVVFVVAYVIYKFAHKSNNTLAQTERYYEEALLNNDSFDGKTINFGKIVLYTNGSSTLNPIVGYSVSPSISNITSRTFSPSSSFKIEGLSTNFNPNFQMLASWSIGTWRKPVDDSMTKLWMPYGNTATIQYDPKINAITFSNFTVINMGSTLTNYPGGIQPILTIYVAWY